MAGEKSPQAFQVYATDHPITPHTLRGRLAERFNELFGQLRNSQNWDDYNKRCGHLRGIEEGIAICEQVEKEQNR